MNRNFVFSVLCALAMGCGGGSKDQGNTEPDLNWNGDDMGNRGDGEGDSNGPESDVVEEPDQVVEDGSDVQGLPTYYPSAELGIRILSPAADGVAEVAGGALSVRGVVMGQAKSVTWTTDKGGAGTADGLPYFTTGKVDLVSGDNLVTVSATDGVETVSDTIRITYNPGFAFGSLRIIPGGFFTNQKTTLRFALSMDAFGNFEPSTLQLCESSESGTCLGTKFNLVDDGDTATSGDEVQEDAVYSAKRDYTRNAPGRLCFRATATVKAGQPYTAASSVRCVDVVDHFTSAQCEASKNVLTEAKSRYETALNQSEPGAAAQSTLQYLQTAPGVAQAGISTGGYGLWVRFSNGVLGAVDTSPSGNRGGSAAGEGSDVLETAQLAAIDPVESKIESKRSLVIAPFRGEFGENDEAVYISNLLNNSSCPAYVVDGPYADGLASLSVFRSMADYGVVVITSHGDAYFREVDQATKQGFGWRHMGSQEVMWSGEGVNCAQMAQTSATCSSQADCPAGTECVITEYSGAGLTGVGTSGICVDYKQIDLRRGNLVLGSERYGILPSHIEEYRGNGFPQSIVYLGSCRSLWNGTMAVSFAAAGAQTVLGYTGYVTTSFAYLQGREAFAEMIQEQKLAGLSINSASVTDPANAGTRLALFGTESLNIYDPEIINPSFEKGDLTGWLKEGDGRVVSQLGATGPADGKYMALLSTGLGYTQQTGTVEQKFCITSGKEKLRVYWKLYSEEFQEFCGSEYMDSFEAVLESENGQVTLVDTWIDALCPEDLCYGCGTQYVGMVESDVSFDQGDVWNIDWQLVEKNIQALAGNGPVTLRFFTGDVGDSIYDTAVLVDSVVIE